MNIWYTARETFRERTESDAWKKYIEWSRLTHLSELVSLDGLLNPGLVEPDYDNIAEYEYIIQVDNRIIDFYSSEEYVLRKLKSSEIAFNMLLAIVQPTEDDRLQTHSNYELLGYDLLDQDFSISALSNCGGFDDSFLPYDLNRFGLIDDIRKAYSVQASLLQNYPNEHHADTNVIAVCKHKIIGQD